MSTDRKEIVQDLEMDERTSYCILFQWVAGHCLAEASGVQMNL